MRPIAFAPRSRPILAALLSTGLLAASLPALAGAASQPVPPAPASDIATAPTASTITLVKVATASQPVLVASANDGSGRLFIVEKGGRVRILKDGKVLPGSFIDVSRSVSTGSEQGLLGLAFHPSFRTNHKFYLDYTDTSGTTVIREYRASTSSPNVVARGSGRTLLRISQPYSNHNGGMIAFGRDGYLYIGTGDGGSSGDPGNRAQNVNSLLGKMLRIDVNGRTSSRPYRIPGSNPYVGRSGLDEIWQRGLRNPWRFSFDRITGHLWIGDVGQNRYEEIDLALRTGSGPGRGINWGWHVMEGRHCYKPASGCSTSGKKNPLAEYSHSANGRCAITGGYVYRGSGIAALKGWYVYGDYCSGEVWAVPSTSASSATAVRLLGTGSGHQISGFGENDSGDLFLCDLNGGVYRIVAR